MKRLLTIAAVAALVAAPAYAQWSQDFEGGIPGDWTVVDNAGAGVVWDTNVAWGDDNWTGGSGMAAEVNSDTAGSADYDTELITHAFVVPAGATLDYVFNYQNFAAYDFVDVDIDAGAGWVNLVSYNEDLGGFKSLPGVSDSLDISGFAGATAQVRFHYYDHTTSPDWDWYIQIDDVVVTPEPGSLALLGLGGLALIRRR